MKFFYQHFNYKMIVIFRNVIKFKYLVELLELSRTLLEFSILGYKNYEQRLIFTGVMTMTLYSMIFFIVCIKFLFAYVTSFLFEI